MPDYTDTVVYWDKVFEKESPTLDAVDPLPFREIEEGVQWVCKGAESVLDFGCGNGRILFRCLGLGVGKGLGIDISPSAVSLARRTAYKNSLTERAEFVTGNLFTLQGITDQSYDAIILFNIVDNMIPDDACYLLSEVKRIVKSDGKVLVKLNDCFPSSHFSDINEFEKVYDNFYRERSGLFFWNLSDQAVESLMHPQLNTERSLSIEFKQYQTWNRLYFFRKQP
jgi:ubiquinone/menaquinone biosynthesis C-methylase UbiE